jgi:non-specific serine/threonine protein kinase
MSAVTNSGRRVSHYDVHELVGTGAMGDVYRATDLRLGRQVALKFLRPCHDAAMRQRMVREARAASALDHPNVCTIFEVDETGDGDVFIAMALYEGETLDRILARGPLPVPRALSIAIQAGRGLAAAHDQLIVHRDIKPGNLMVTKGDAVKILDFGIAVGRDHARITDDHLVVGTPAYMSPEQLRGEPIDQRTDIWALGVVLHEMLTGEPPFGADDASTVVARILASAPTRVTAPGSAIPAQLQRVLDRSLARTPRLRYERMEAMVQQLVDVRAALDSDAVARRSTGARSSIAVLPFEDMSEGRDQGFLCDGIAEEILRALSRIPDLDVAARTSSARFRHNGADVREIGACLGVETVLEGSVRRVGDRIRIFAQLVNVADGYRLWDERFDREMKDIFAVEDEIADRIARALKVTLAEHRYVQGAPDAQAHEAYLQGRQFFHQHRRKAFGIALQLFEQAIEICPHYARAHAGVADCHAFLRLYFGGGEDAVGAADESSSRALALEPDLSDAHASRGLALFLKHDTEGAERHLRRAIELHPRLYDPHYIFGRLSFSTGRIDDAATHFAEACAIVPEAYDSWYLLGMCYRRLERPERSRSANFECIEAVKRRVRSHPDDTRAWTMGASVLVEMGEPDAAAAWVGRALAIDADEPIIQYNAACVYVGLCRFDEALASLAEALRHGGVMPDWAANDPDLDPLRTDPRFDAVLSGARR